MISLDMHQALARMRAAIGCARAGLRDALATPEPGWFRRRSRLMRNERIAAARTILDAVLAEQEALLDAMIGADAETLERMLAHARERAQHMLDVARDRLAQERREVEWLNMHPATSGNGFDDPNEEE